MKHNRFHRSLRTGSPNGHDCFSKFYRDAASPHICFYSTSTVYFRSLSELSYAILISSPHRLTSVHPAHVQGVDVPI